MPPKPRARRFSVTELYHDHKCVEQALQRSQRLARMRRLPEDRALAVGTVGTVGQNCRTTVGLLSDYCRNLLSDCRTGALPEDGGELRGGGAAKRGWWVERGKVKRGKEHAE